MYDHPTFPALIFQLNQSVVVDISLAYNFTAYADYLYNGKGALTSIGKRNYLYLLRSHFI